MTDRPGFTRASDFPPQVLRLFDQYVHGLIDRRAFLSHAAGYATAGVTASGLLAALSPDFARAQLVQPDDARIAGTRLDIPSPAGNGHINAYVVRPARAPKGRKPGVVLVVHENRGLNPHIEDIARRIALDGYIAVAPDALTTLGGYPGDEDQARALFGKLDQARTREDFVAAAHHATMIGGGNARLGVVGFCYGGGIANFLATRIHELRAAVAFYGVSPPLDQVGNIKAELLIQMAGMDERVNAMWPDYEKALKAAHVRYHAYSYAGVQHGFNNNTTPRFDADAAALAWKRTMDLFARTLRG